MSRRTRATVVAVPILLVLWAAVFLVPLPYVTYSPGPTVDVLGGKKGEEYIQIEGRETFRDDGELRMTTVYVTFPDGRVSLFDAARAWLDPDRAVVARSLVYDDNETRESAEQESAVQMVSSQDVAIAAALNELGVEVESVIEVLSVVKDQPADGVLELRDVLVAANGEKLTGTQQIVDAVQATPKGESITFDIIRKGAQKQVKIVPETIDGAQRIGIIPGPGFTFPYEINVDIGEDIGGPSAGLIFALGIYDTLTPGSMTDGKTVAGTGTIDPEGKVGPIGGIQQKIAAARDEGAEIFLVPAANCAEARGASNGDMQLVKAQTMHDARLALEEWVEDPDADLPSCEAA